MYSLWCFDKKVINSAWNRNPSVETCNYNVLNIGSTVEFFFS